MSEAHTWKLLGMEHGDAATLLARSIALLDTMPDHGPALRWYVADAPAIVLGRGQRPEDVHTHLPVAARHSGGGAVLMDHSLLSLDIVLPAGHPWLDGDVGDVFVRVGRAWAGALGELGVTGLRVHEGASAARRLGSERERLLAAICYALPGRGEVLHDGRKLVGLAQRRRRNGALIQCGLLLRWQPEALLRALGAAPDDHEIKAAAVGLATLLSPLPDQQKLTAVVERWVTGGLLG